MLNILSCGQLMFSMFSTAAGHFCLCFFTLREIKVFNLGKNAHLVNVSFHLAEEWWVKYYTNQPAKHTMTDKQNRSITAN